MTSIRNINSSDTIDHNPLEDTGVPRDVDGPKYVIAFIDVVPGDRRIQLHVREEDAELALKVMRKMQTQGQTSGVQPTSRKFDPRDVTSRKVLMEMLSVAEALLAANVCCEN